MHDQRHFHDKPVISMACKHGIVLVLIMIAWATPGCSKDNSDTQSTASKTMSPAAALKPLIDPNSADAADLASVPGLSDEMIQTILSQRPFATPTELHAAIGTGKSPEDMAAIYSVMFVKIDLNTGAEADMLLIPNTLRAGKLAHEFEEYRPYRNIDQFRREIGKYVDANEVARLERYIVLH